MNSELVFYEKRAITKKDIVEMKIWKIPRSKNFPEGVKYSFVYIHNSERILGYDNEREKGHHRHFKGKEIKVKFKGPEILLTKFKEEVKELVKKSTRL